MLPARQGVVGHVEPVDVDPVDGRGRSKSLKGSNFSQNGSECFCGFLYRVIDLRFCVYQVTPRQYASCDIHKFLNRLLSMKHFSAVTV